MVMEVGEAKNVRAQEKNESLLEPELSTRIPATRGLVCCGLCLGMLNNLPFCVLMAASQATAKDFQMDSYVGLFTTASAAASISGTFLNANCIVGKVSMANRIYLLLGLVSVGYCIIAATYLLMFSWMAPAPPWGLSVGFAACLGGASMTYLCQAAGECTNLALYQKFTVEMLSVWGTGTGLSGLLGSVVYLGFSAGLGMSTGEICCILLTTGPVYYFLYMHVVKASEKTTNRVSESGSSTRSSASLHGAAGISRPSLLSADDLSGEESRGLSIETFKETSSSAKWILINLATVYTLEYLIDPGLVDRATGLCRKNDGFLAVNAFTLMWAMYNVGVTVSRSSVACFRLKRVWVLTLLQSLNAMLWIGDVFQHWHLNAGGDSGYITMCVHMIWVGFMGGACYSNCMYLFQTDPKIPNDLRELGLNCGFMMSNVGIACATLITTFLDHNIFSKQSLFPDGCPGKDQPNIGVSTPFFDAIMEYY